MTRWILATLKRFQLQGLRQRESRVVLQEMFNFQIIIRCRMRKAMTWVEFRYNKTVKRDLYRRSSLE